MFADGDFPKRGLDKEKIRDKLSITSTNRLRSTHLAWRKEAQAAAGVCRRRATQIAIDRARRRGRQAGLRAIARENSRRSRAEILMDTLENSPARK